MEILETIEKQVNWYYQHSDKASINDLLSLQDKLGVNSYYLAQLYAETYQSYLEKVYNTKTKKIKSYLSKKAEKIEDKKLTDKLAQSIADDESLAEFADELFGEGQKEQYRILLSQVNSILNAIQQRISYLKLEYNKT